ncbi:hypothetical protein C0Q70_05380 [Pomacea canaliculata]|uniref:Centriolar satellite-associated tubulin polyglutamylase complex regulator 1 n=2 Tax=Pomacea canaliculata TaxID=400727 RepID=A0A2T7PL53_POMCA|nr:hypothetical protein C0Q70_05380 [Pomacea canaliculata]
MFREFAFIRSTPHNRASFVCLFWKCFRLIGKKGDLLSIQEYHSLLGLLCTDFPFQLVQKTARIVLIDDALDCLISFSDFIYAFQVQFYYEEFLDKCGELYKSLLQSTYNPMEPVIVPTSSSQDIKGVHHSQHMPADGVDAMQFFRTIYPLCDRVDYSTPPVASLKESLFSTPRISFYGFLMSIAKNEAINEHIGRLPPKNELLEGVDPELTSPPVKIAAASSGRSSLTLGSSVQRTTLSSTVKPAVSKADPNNIISYMVRNKLSEHVQRIRSSKRAQVASSDSDDTSTDTSDSV